MVKRSIVWAVPIGSLVLSLAWGPVRGVRGADGAKPRRGRMKAVVVQKGPPIDGRGDGGVWATCPPMPLGACTSEQPGPLKTTARVLFGPKRLYVSWWCAEPETASLARAVTRRDGAVWQDDCVELFVTGDRREGYRHFVINPRGCVYDARRPVRARQYDKAYDPPVEVKTHVEKATGWSVTLSVPLKDLGAYVGTGQTWVVNLNRTRPARGGKPMGEWSWAVLGSNDYHQVMDYGQITGVTVPRRADGVTREATPAPAPPAYMKGTQAGSVTVYLRKDELAIRDGGQGLAETIGLAIRGSRGLKVAFLARGTAPGTKGDGYGTTDSGAPVTWPVTFNLFDRRSNDNTTSKSYRHLACGRWQPMVYFCDHFRYNAIPGSTVAAATDYSNLRFYGRAPGREGTLTLRDLCVYRGEDTTPPTAPTGLAATVPTGSSAPSGVVRLSWRPAADNVGVALYVISRAGKGGKFVKVGESALPKYSDGAGRGKCRYRVLAVDFQDNLSAWCESVSAFVASGPRTGFFGTQHGNDRRRYAAKVRTIHAAGRGKVRKGVVLCFGDSLTGATSYRTNVEAGLGRYRVVARGYPGMRTSFARKRIGRELREVNPEFCLILYGTNNSKAARAIPPAMEDLKAVADACAAHGTVPIIGTIPPRGFQDRRSEPEARYNIALLLMCHKERIPIAYCFEAFQAAGDRRALLAGDGVHTHRHGFAVYARAWREAMDHVNFVLLDRPDNAPASAPKAAAPPPAAPKQPARPVIPADPTEPIVPAWPPRGKPARCRVARDTWISKVQDERYGSNGAASRLKLKGQQEYSIFDLDPAAVKRLKGKIITGAMLRVRCASPKAPLLRVTVSTVAAPWVEGTSSRYRRQDGSSCYHQAELGRRDWAYPGSTFMDVAFGKGHTIWRFAEASPPDGDGWQQLAVSPDVVAARVAGLSEGFGLYDDVGSIWSYRGGKFTYTYFPNRFIHSRESKGSEPRLDVWTHGTDEAPPAAVRRISAVTSGLPPGQAWVVWPTPPDAGLAGTLGFHVVYEAGGRAGAVPRYLIPMALRPGQIVRMHLQDLPFEPGQEVKLTVRAVDRAGNVGPPATKAIRVSADPRLADIPDGGLKPFPPSKVLPGVGGLKVAVVDLLDKVHPKTGAMIPAQPAGYAGGNHLWSAAKKLVRLHAARNEAVCFQVNLAGKAPRASVELSFPDEAGLRATVGRFDYVATKAGPLGDVIVPVGRTFAVPFADDPQAARASNVSLLCEVYVPHETPPGRKAGRLRVAAGGETLDVAVDLTVWDFTLPNKLSFVPEMNCYGTADPTGNLGYYRVAHEHRLCLNRLYYGWSGSPSLAPRWDGERFDFARWDKQFGPLLDGSAFADLPRAGEPVDVFYLPFNENWPADVHKHYRGTYWIDEAFAPAYKAALRKAFAAFAAHCDAKGWHEPIFEFYLNNKVYYKRGGWRRSSAPWIFDEPVNTQDFWALRWYGILWHQAVGPVRGKAKMWYRGDVSYSQHGRDLLRDVMDIECLGGTSDQKVRMKRDEQMLGAQGYFTEYGSANDPAAANLQPALWCLKAWADGAVGVLPWQTIGSKDHLAKGSATGLFIPRGRQIVPSVRLKAFRRGQQDTEYLTLLMRSGKQPFCAVAAALRARIDLTGQVHKTFEMDAGTLRFAKASPTALWRLRTAVGRMVSAKAPPYRRCIRPLPSPRRYVGALTDVGYVHVAPKLAPSAPEMD